MSGLRTLKLNLDCQAVAALGATSSQNGAATAGARADEETVGALTTDDGRLIGTFHVGDSPEFKRATKAAENP